MDNETRRGIEYLRGIFESGKILRLGEPQKFGQFNYSVSFEVTAYSKQWEFAASRDQLSDLPAMRAYQESATALARALEQRFHNVSPSKFVTASGSLIHIQCE
jgi:hypothetical protein